MGLALAGHSGGDELYMRGRGIYNQKEEAKHGNLFFDFYKIELRSF
jgi:hypothetical protein